MLGVMATRGVAMAVLIVAVWVAAVVVTTAAERAKAQDLAGKEG